MSTDHQQDNNMSSSPSSSKPSLDIDKPGLTRAEVLAAFPTVFEVDSSRPASDHAIICFTCNKTIIARSSTQVIKHLKAFRHVKRQMALDKVIKSKQPDVVPKSTTDHEYASVCTLPFAQQQQQIYNSSTLSWPLDLDQPKLTRNELLAALPNIIEVDLSRPPAEKAIRCLTCQKTIITKKRANEIVIHLKTSLHARRQKALDSGLSPEQYDILSTCPPGTFRPIGEDTVQCITCKTNLNCLEQSKVAIRHLESDLHLRTLTVAKQHEAVEQMTRKNFELLFVQTFFVDCGFDIHKFEKGRKVIEAMFGRTLAGESYLRKMVKEMKDAKEAEKEGKGEWKRITIPGEPVPDSKLVDTVPKRKKKKEKGQGKAKRQKPDEEEEHFYEDEAGKALSNINFY